MWKESCASNWPSQSDQLDCDLGLWNRSLTRALLLWSLYCIWLNSNLIPSCEHWHWPKHQQISPRYRWQHCLVFLSSPSLLRSWRNTRCSGRACVTKPSFCADEWTGLFAFRSVSCHVSSAAFTCMTGLVIWKWALIHPRPGTSYEFNPVTCTNSGMWTTHPATWNTYTHYCCCCQYLIEWMSKASKTEPNCNKP